MRRKLIRLTVEEDARIAAGIAADPDAAPDLSIPTTGIIRKIGRSPKAKRH
jgi:hypothetical protein